VSYTHYWKQKRSFARAQWDEVSANLRAVLMTCLFTLLMVTGMIVADHVNGPIFPDALYCVVGAGMKVGEPSRSNANSKQIFYYPVLSASKCQHDTLWGGWK